MGEADYELSFRVWVGNRLNGLPNGGDISSSGTKEDTQTWMESNVR